MPAVSVIIPAFNEAASVQAVVRDLRGALEAGCDPWEIIVVDDGSTDGTGALADQAGVRVIRHATRTGYGNSILAGIQQAGFDQLAIIDADGTYPASQLPELLRALGEHDLEMVVGARQGLSAQEPLFKSWGRAAFRLLAEYVTGRSIPDLNSGLRVFRRRLIREFEPLACRTFSFTTGLTLFSMLTDAPIRFVPIGYTPRRGRSKVRLCRDSWIALRVILNMTLARRPWKIYAPLAASASIIAAGMLIW